MPKDKNQNPLQQKWYDKPSIWGFQWKKIIVGIIVIVIVPIFISYFMFQYQFSQTTRVERKNLANGYLSDIENVNHTLFDILTSINDPNSPDYHKNAVRIARPLYPDWGLYYSNRQDIAKFEPEVSEDLYNFYYKILNAEEMRVSFNNYETLYPINPNDPIEVQKGARENTHTVKLQIWNSMYNMMLDCYFNEIPKLKTELQKE